MIRQFRIHLNFLQNVCVRSHGLLASFAAHPQLRVLRGLKHDTGPYLFLYMYFIFIIVFIEETHFLQSTAVLVVYTGWAKKVNPY